ncbi:MAG: hypothetical protein B7Z33_03115 [Sphingomonadales bacterium 12-68-11]|nr:MAG: hypothetical protein B7Z33_03115 [Sphingomonadales bacterium 12-68-11]OYX16859.1 MAG: hypothetical protein B7Z07_01700 [Sphingomonadales bacterium 32-67-7]
MLAAVVTLSACGQEAPAPTEEPTMAATSEAAMGGMAMSAEAKMAQGTGVVTAIDTSAGTITLDHEAMPEIEWPAMTMTFSVKPAVLDGVKVGDKVAFDASIQGSAAEVTAISSQ